MNKKKADNWHYFQGKGEQHPITVQNKLPSSPPWRQFRQFETMNLSEQTEIRERWGKILELANAKENERGLKKGRTFRIHTQMDGKQEELTEESLNVLNAVNAAIYLRRPLLITGRPGAGKTSLAYAIAYELHLGSVLTWPITTRSSLQDSLYRYDAIARLQDEKKKAIGQYITLGAVGTAFLPWELPRVLLIDEIDKSDINLPNDLLNLFEEGCYEITELIREVEDSEIENAPVEVRTSDREIKVPISRGRVSCCAFPIVVMTSNGERDFPEAFMRRCIRVRMPDPDTYALKQIIEAHFEDKGSLEGLDQLIADFREDENRAIDQLLNTLHVLAKVDSNDADTRDQIKDLLLKPLGEES